MKISKISFLLVIISAILMSCGNHEVSDPPKDDSIAVSDSLVKTAHIAVAAAGDITDVIKLNGKIQPNESKQAKVYALVSGKIRSVHVELGDYVKKGQLLAVIQSTEVAGVSSNLSLAESDVAMAKKSMETTKDLYEGKLATEQEYISAKMTYNKALAELNRSKQVSAISGGRNASYVVTAPISGFIIEKNITNNSEVRSDNNTNLFAIADLSNVWVIANVYEADMNNIHLGDEVKVNTLADPNKDYVGKIDKIYNVLDPATRTMKVRISMNNPNGELKPEMFATVKVSGRPSSNQVVSIPSQSIVLNDSKNFVIVKKDNKLSVREISIIKRVDPTAYISGVSVGEQVVTDNLIFFFEALNRK